MTNHRNGEALDRPNKACTRRPLIVMIADVYGSPTVSGEREYRLRAEYSKAIAQAGGLALMLPHDPIQTAAVLAIADGLLVTGSLPGAAQDSERDCFERKLVKGALDTGMPLLGICHGMQVIGQCLGGTLERDDPKLLAEITPHIPKQVPDELAHEIAIEPGSQLMAWSDSARVQVNSLHRHALLEGGRYRVTARADDGVIEAIEGLGEAFCLGVQWHPEFRLTVLDSRIFSGFIERCAAWSKMDSQATQEVLI